MQAAKFKMPCHYFNSFVQYITLFCIDGYVKMKKVSVLCVSFAAGLMALLKERGTLNGMPRSKNRKRYK